MLVTPAGAAEPSDNPVELVSALHSAFGEHHARAVHTKGLMLEGTFTPSPEGKKYSKAPLFAQSSVPVTVRFSDFAGVPTVPDNADVASPHGFAIRFTLPDRETLDLVTHSFNGFPTSNAKDFGILIRAIGASGPTVAKPSPLDQYLAKNPLAAAFLTTQKPPPVSYGTVSYFGVNAFRFVNDRGVATPVRYRFVPKAGEQFLSAADAKSRSPDYLSDEIVQRLRQGPVSFEWFAQIGEPGDVLDDPSHVWPDSRRLVSLGTVAIKSSVKDPAALDRSTVFLPAKLPAGIEAADPMVAIRNAAYGVSFSQRQ